MSTAVRIEKTGATGLVILNAPPVNALGQGLRAGLIQAVEALNADPQVEVISIYGEGRALSAGADIREFGQAPQAPNLPVVLNAIEASAKPVVITLHGVALGGGLELCLACHARVALPSTRLGLPEVTLGLLPGAGGTQRLPRLVPLEIALEAVTTGRQFSAEEALAAGLVDRLADGTPHEVALQAAADVLSSALETRRTSDLKADVDQALIAGAVARLSDRRPVLSAPIKAAKAISHAAEPIESGLKAERSLFLELMESPDRQGLVHAFGAERAVRKIPETGTPRNIASAGVIGGGTMGVGIATALLTAGLSVTLVETTLERAESACLVVANNLDGAVKRGKLTQALRDENLQKLTPAVDYDALADCDLVIEAVFEDMAVKTEIFSKLDRICKAGAILGTNTSYLDVNQIAAATTRPEDVIGLHFFSPAHVMRLLEVVVADKTGSDVVATAFALAGRMKKVAVRSGVCDGFIGNRILAHYRKSADYMLLDGADFDQIDKALEDFGFAMGPFAVADLAGLDIAWANRKRKAATRPPEERYSAIADRLCEAGSFGRKTGSGFYTYGSGKARSVNPDAEAAVQAERQAEGIEPRSFSDEEIVSRYMAAMISEAVRVLEEGIAQRPVDIDAVFLFGYGFPRHLGGPLNYADRIGAANLVSRIESYAKEDPYFWQVPALLRNMAETGQRFAGLNKENTDGS
jgi:3-hydroxyacyl-CoA dehydrogenase